MNYRIRPAEPADAEQLTRLAAAVSAEPEGWLISVAGEWRSAGDERRYLLVQAGNRGRLGVDCGTAWSDDPGTKA